VKNERDRVVVVGSGVIGLCVAYYLLRGGRRVVVLEREEADGDNCTRENAGMVVPSHFVPLAAPGVISQGMRWLMDPESPFWVRPRLSGALARWGWLFLRHATDAHVKGVAGLLRDLNLESRRLFEELEGEGSFGLEQRGLLSLCETEKMLAEEVELAEAARELGLKAEVCDAKRVAELDPDVEMKVAGGVWQGDDCHMDPSRFLGEMQKRIEAMGGEIHFGKNVVGIENGKVVVEGGEEWEGTEVVVAGGAWTPDLARLLGLRLPMQAGKGYSLTLEDPVQLPRLCSILTEAKVAVTPMGKRLRVAGTMEIGGNELSVNPRRVRGIIKAASRVFPRFRLEDFDGIVPWAGLRPCSPDGLPYVGRVPGHDRVMVATGHSMMGLSLGPVTGRMVADLLDGSQDVPGLERLAPGRFS
jgi:D-amino-acid dehydrogenase